MGRRNQNSRWSRFARDLFVLSRLTALRMYFMWDVRFSNLGLMITMYCHSSTAAVLFSFEPHFEEHQGKRLRRYLVNCARRYRQMLESLLHEVIFTFRLIQPKRRLNFRTCSKHYDSILSGACSTFWVAQDTPHATGLVHIYEPCLSGLCRGR